MLTAYEVIKNKRRMFRLSESIFLRVRWETMQRGIKSMRPRLCFLVRVMRTPFSEFTLFVCIINYWILILVSCALTGCKLYK